MTKEVLTKAIVLNDNIKRIEDLLDCLDKHYSICFYEKIGKLICDLYSTDPEIKRIITETFKDLLNKNKSNFESL